MLNCLSRYSVGITDSIILGYAFNSLKTYFCQIFLGLPLFPIYFILFKLVIIL